jgi:hypothetical protein
MTLHVHTECQFFRLSHVSRDTLEKRCGHVCRVIGNRHAIGHREGCPAMLLRFVVQEDADEVAVVGGVADVDAGCGVDIGGDNRVCLFFFNQEWKWSRTANA